MTFNDGVRNLALQCESPDDVRRVIVELVLACWEDSDGSLDTLTALLGSVSTANQVLYTYLGGHYDSE